MSSAVSLMIVGLWILPSNDYPRQVSGLDILEEEGF